MGRRCRIVRKIPNRSFPYEPGDTPVLADHVADAWVEQGFAEELNENGGLESAAVAGPGESGATQTTPPSEMAGYEKRQRSPGWYDVVDENGGAVNDKALRENDADALIAKLEA